MPGAELKHFTINQNTNKEASEAWEYWKRKGVNISDRICQLIKEERRREKQLELATQDGGLQQDEASLVKTQDEERKKEEEEQQIISVFILLPRLANLPTPEKERLFKESFPSLKGLLAFRKRCFNLGRDIREYAEKVYPESTIYHIDREIERTIELEKTEARTEAYIQARSQHSLTKAPSYTRVQQEQELKQDEEGELDQEQKIQQLVRARIEEEEAEEQIRQQLEDQIIKEMEENPALKEYLDKKQEELTNLILQGDIAEAAERIHYLPLSEIDRIRRSSDGEEASAIARQKVLEEYSKEQLVKQKQMDSLDTLFWSKNMGS